MASQTPVSARDQVERFHLCFLRLLTAGPDKAHFIVKGGCNLRFFFGSVRYSEDLDLDVVVTSKTTLTSKVDKLLAGPPLAALLRGRGASIASWSAPKQTDTTQRWKVALAIDGMSASIPTKVEFSRRGASAGHVFESVDLALARHHGLTPPLVEHYDAAHAARQKIEALAGRTETQARDVFDLCLLLERLGSTPIPTTKALRDLAGEAADRAMSIGFDAYSAQVGAYLSVDQAEAYATREAWDAMQLTVVNALQALS